MIYYKCSHNANKRGQAKVRIRTAGAFEPGRTLADMKMHAAVAITLMCCAGVAAAQEKPVPRDSRRITIPGCVRGSTFITGIPKSHETTPGVQEGQRYRLTAKKGVLKDMEKQKASMIEVTGLVRAGAEPGGISIAGGRVRIGGAMPRDPRGSDISRDPRYNETVLDVESWQPLPDACPLK
jgi:hypothetical protein